MTGDFTPAYAMLDDVGVYHVRALMPETNIIFIMRNPIERAWSHAKMILGKHGFRSVSDITEKEVAEFISGKPSCLRGGYTQMIDRWNSRFPDDQVLLFFFDDIVANPLAIVDKVLDFIGVDNVSDEMQKILNSTVHKGEEMTMPDNIVRLLYEEYESELVELTNWDGEAPKSWLVSVREPLEVGF